jgi:hypothetical protein
VARFEGTKLSIGSKKSPSASAYIVKSEVKDKDDIKNGYSIKRIQKIWLREL